MKTRQNASAIQLDKIENLVFQGGGMRGLAYLGALEEICNEKEKGAHIKLPQIKRLCGASAGAITALLIALGHDINVFKDLFENLDLVELIDDGVNIDNILIDDGKNPEQTRKKFTTKSNFFLLQYLHQYILEDHNTATTLNSIHIAMYGVYKLALKFGYNVFSGSIGIRKKNIRKFLKEMKQYIPSLSYLVEFITREIVHFTAEQFEMLLNYMIQHFTSVNMRKTEQQLLKEYFSNCMEDLQEVIDRIYYSLKAIYTHCGLFTGDTFTTWLEERLEDRLGKEIKLGDNKIITKQITFGELNAVAREHKNLGIKELYVIGLNLSKELTEIFSHRHSKEVLVVDAVRASMSIPFFFIPPTIRYKENGTIKFSNAVYTDGGVNDNYPIWIFDRIGYIDENALNPNQMKINGKTLGFSLVDSETKKLFTRGKVSKKNKVVLSQHQQLELGQFSIQVVRSIYHKQKSDHAHRGNYFRTIYIDTVGVGTIDFNLDEESRNTLIVSGRSSVRDFRKCIANGFSVGEILFPLENMKNKEEKYLKTFSGYRKESWARSLAHSIYTGLFFSGKFFIHNSVVIITSKRMSFRDNFKTAFLYSIIPGALVGLFNLAVRHWNDRYTDKLTMSCETGMISGLATAIFFKAGRAQPGEILYAGIISGMLSFSSAIFATLFLQKRFRNYEKSLLQQEQIQELENEKMSELSSSSSSSSTPRVARLRQTFFGSKHHKLLLGENLKMKTQLQDQNRAYVQELMSKATLAIPSKGKIQILFKDKDDFKQFQQRLYQDFGIHDPQHSNHARKQQIYFSKERDDEFCLTLTAAEFNKVTGYNAYSEVLSKIQSPDQESDYSSTPSTSSHTSAPRSAVR